MRVLARLAVFGVAALLATQAGAQTAAAPGQAQPAPGDYPYAPPPGFERVRSALVRAGLPRPSKCAAKAAEPR